MCSNYCRCCFNKNGILMAITTKSSHKDDKTLLDYLNSILGAFIKEHDSEFICVRCSKALQVAYHFINMVKESIESKEKVQNENGAIILNNSSIAEMQNECREKSAEDSPSSSENEMSQYKLIPENQLKILKSDIPSNELVLSKILKSGEIFTPDFNTDTGLSEPNEKGTSDFKCIICHQIFKDKHSFFEHNRQQHKEIVPFKCKLCSFYTCYTESLFKHCQKSHGLNSVALDLYQTKQEGPMTTNVPDFEITYLCVHCNFKGFSQKCIVEHLSNVHSIEADEEDSFVKKMYNCPACHRSFKTLKSAKIHFSMYHICSFKKSNNTYNNRKFDCENCGKLFDLKSGLFMHRRLCDRRKAVNCNFCNLQFTSVLNYDRHLQKKHSVAIRHECEICGKSFKCSEYLTVHRKRHNERYYQCDLCSKNYISNAELKVHKQRIHAIKHIAMSCSNCGKMFAHSALLRDHENREHKKRFHKCDYCDFSSYSSSAVKIHQFKHTGKPYKCQICKKEFAFRKVLRQHCEKHHSIILTNEEMAEMFKKTYGYTSRFDAFSKQNNSLEITEINDLELEVELEEFGLTLEDIMDDLFDREIHNKILP